MKPYDGRKLNIGAATGRKVKKQNRKIKTSQQEK